MSENSKKLSTEPYKGVRDFFPEDMAVQNHIFAIWKSISQKYGYEEYAASVLEPADMYAAKSGEEIVNEQTYTFKDRGERDVTLRPEMTPTVARMVAARKRELTFPLRWFSIPNLFRYEQPQRGRTREHWQLNVDIFGVESMYAEIEIMNMAYDITSAYGLKSSDFEIRINNRKIVNYITKDLFAFSPEISVKISKLIDKKSKLPKEVFEKSVDELIGDADKTQKFLTLLNSQNFQEFTSQLPQTKEEHAGLKEIREVITGLNNLGINNVRFDQTLMRGFDYYTGIVFEVFDLNPINRRSIFGGGRYEDLLSLFGNDKVTAVGFGAGDVVAKDLMDTYGKLPTVSGTADLDITIVGVQNTPYALSLAKQLREKGIKVITDLSGKKLGDQVSNAAKRNITAVLCIGDEEVKNGKLRIKILKTGEEILTSESEIAQLLSQMLSK